MTALTKVLGSTSGLVVTAALAALGLYLLVYHLDHALLAVPYIVLLACPLMHLMHRGHHGHDRRRDSRRAGERTQQSPETK